MSRLKALLGQTKSLLSGAGPKATERAFLVVEDDPGTRQTICEYLRSFGYKKVVEAADGVEAITLLEGAEIDFIISDWEMPNASGIELLRTLKNDARFRDIPFIMITSPVSQERLKIENAANLSVDGYIIKPFRAQVLQQKILETLASASVRGRKGVLLVDDDHSARETIKEFLERLGYGPIFEANDGAGAFELLQKHATEIGFVLSDWEMPGLAGIDLLRHIRKDPELGRTPFIMVTSQTSIERLKLEQALDLNVDHYLLKPFRVGDLREKIDFVLKRTKLNINLEAELTHGEELLKQYRWEEAIKAFRAASDLDPNGVRAYVGLGIAHRGLGDGKSVMKAVQFFRKAISISPSYDPAYVEMALTFEQSRASDQAIEILKEAAARCAFSDTVHFHLGRLLLTKGDDKEGVARLNKALELNPQRQEVRQLLDSVSAKKSSGGGSSDPADSSDDSNPLK